MFVILILAVIFGMCIIHKSKKLHKYEFGSFTKRVLSNLDIIDDELNNNQDPVMVNNATMSKILDASDVHVPATYIDILKDLKADDEFTLGEALTVASMLQDKQNINSYYHLKSPKPTNRKIEKKPVFLGGSCNPTTWRGDIVIPMFQAKHIEFFNPQVDEWTEALVQAEAKAKEQAQLLFFVLDNETRSLSSILETCYFLGTGKPLTLIVKEFDGPATNKWEIQGEELDEYEIDLINDLKRYVLEIAKLEHIPVFKDTTTAAHYVSALYDGAVDLKGSMQNKRLGISSLKYILGNVQHASATFDSVSSKSGHIKNIKTLTTACSTTYKRVENDVEVEAAVKRLGKVNFPLKKDLYMAYYSELYSQLAASSLSMRRKRKTATKPRIIVPDWSDNAFIKKKKGEIEAFENLLRESDAPVDFLPFYDVLYESRPHDVHLMIIPEGEHSTLCMMQAAFLLGRGSHVVLYMRDYCADGTRAPPSPTAQKDYRRCRVYLQDMAILHKMEIFDSPQDCVEHVKTLIS